MKEAIIAASSIDPLNALFIITGVALACGFSYAFFGLFVYVVMHNSEALLRALGDQVPLGGHVAEFSMPPGIP